MSARLDQPTDFTLYDGRRHVLGGSMLAAMDRKLRHTSHANAHVPFHVKRAKFMRKTGCNGLLHTRFDGAWSQGVEDAAAHAVGILGQRPAEAWFVPDETRPVAHDRSSSHDISNILSSGDFQGSCQLRAEGLEAALCILVEANKLVQLAGAGLARMFGGTTPVTELVYLEDIVIDAALARLDTAVAVESLGVRAGGGRLYTLNRLSFSDADGSPRRCRIGFSFHVKAAGADA